MFRIIPSPDATQDSSFSLRERLRTSIWRLIASFRLISSSSKGMTVSVYPRFDQCCRSSDKDKKAASKFPMSLGEHFASHLPYAESDPGKIGTVHSFTP